MSEWKQPNTIIGSVAEGKNYFRRELTESELWEEIEKGNYILFNAPRRTGKSSIMKYMAAYCPKNMICQYENISSDNSSQKFYQRLLRMVLSQLETRKLVTDTIKDYITSIGIESIGQDGLTFKDRDTSIDYKEKLLLLIPKMKEVNQRIVLFLDEFPDVIKKISKEESPEAALDLLHTLRTLNTNDQFKGNFTLVLAGSIGLDHVVSKVGRAADINYFKRVQLDHLHGNQPKEIVAFLTTGASMQLDEACTNHLLEKLKKPIPYFIQLLIVACNKLLEKEKRTEATREDIDTAWKQVLLQHNHFEDWQQRLQDHCAEDYDFLIEVLTWIAHEGSIDIRELYNAGKRHDKKHAYKTLLDDILIRDGYLEEDDQAFTFISPLLQDWWKNRHPINYLKDNE